MSPEQLRGKPVDFRSDIFSLGIVLFQMATGERPFKGATAAEVHSAILRDSPEPVDLVNVEFPHDVARVVRLCLEKDPDSRLQSVRDVRNELSIMQEESSSEDVRTAPYRQDSGIEDDSVLERSPRLGWFLLFGVLAVLAVLAIWNWWGDREPSKPEISPAAQALIDQAQLYELRGVTRENLGEAESRYRRALELEPGHPTIMGHLAAILTDVQANYPTDDLPLEIRALAEAALERDPDNVDAWVALGHGSLFEAAYGASEKAARKAVEADPEDAAGHCLLGQALVKQGVVEQGVVEIRRAVSLAGADIGPRLVLASTLSDLGRQNEAAVEYEKVLGYSPDSPTALNNLGIIYGRQGRYLDAIPLLKRFLRIHEDPVAAYNLATCYFFLDRLPEAVANYELALDIDPDHAWAPHGLADTYLKLGASDKAIANYEKALANYDRMIEAGGRDATMLGIRAVVAARLSRFDEAIEDIAEAERMNPEFGLVLFNAAQVYALAGDKEATYAYTRRSINAGYPRQEFDNDPIFAEFRSESEFLSLLERP
jgi:tetratricopeptide (TPR) repeat protein